ncbi:hypothetical protein HPP92_019558 [Vanilla planifolia]|uniref:ADF-H domain-containing protein n=1 Tax=Vanilla planifolia TaxID=51239 RepID=A0A835Q0T6_VANPL|nr:hypothetical protein HPP92_019558 [Vanilla planifolia]
MALFLVGRDLISVFAVLDVETINGWLVITFGKEFCFNLDFHSSVGEAVSKVGLEAQIQLTSSSRGLISFFTLPIMSKASKLVAHLTSSIYRLQLWRLMASNHVNFFQSKKDCRYAVYDFDFVTEENCQKSKIFFIAWSPSLSRIRAKMLYATSKERFRREMDGVHYEIQATDPTELDIEILRDRAH